MKETLSLALVVCLVASACGGRTPTAPTPTPTPSSQPALPDITGIYVLMTLDGNNLPYTLLQEGGVNVTSGTFTVKADGTCSSYIAVVLSSGAASSRQVSCSYTREGSTLTMQWQGAGRTTGTIEGDSFTMYNDGTLYAYRRAL
jgi:hypothetical protein